MKSYQKYFSKSLSANPDTLFFQGHSHHLWPDSAIKGQEQSTQDSVALYDHKWSKIFQEIIPAVRSHIASMINYPDAENIVFSSNTHDFVTRLLTSFHQEGKRKILTTKSEFHSFKRQMMRFEELGLFEVHWLEITDGDEKNIEKQITEAAKSFKPDVIFFSQCFFDSGYFISEESIKKIVNSTSAEVVVDIYHSFATRQLNFSSFGEKVHLIGGGYKYAQAGEGVCFLIPSKKYQANPVLTGWFASFKNLEQQTGRIDFSAGAQRFWGATFDPSALYRFKSVWDCYQKEKISLDEIHAHVLECQKLFVEKFHQSILSPLGNLLISNIEKHGHFIALKLKSEDDAKKLHEALLKQKIETDHRGNRLRFGFGLYVDLEDVNKLFSKLSVEMIRKNKALQLFTKEYLQVCKQLNHDQIAQFLEDYRLLHTAKNKKVKKLSHKRKIKNK
jgi:kynureninase